MRSFAKAETLQLGLHAAGQWNDVLDTSSATYPSMLTIYQYASLFSFQWELLPNHQTDVELNCNHAFSAHRWQW